MFNRLGSLGEFFRWFFVLLKENSVTKTDFYTSIFLGLRAVVNGLKGFGVLIIQYYPMC